MFGLRGSRSHPVWKRIEDDFVLGVCPRVIFGYITLDADGHWTAFNDDARAVTVSDQLGPAQQALWETHVETHRESCEARGHWPILRRPRASGAARPASERTEFRMLRT